MTGISSSASLLRESSEELLELSKLSFLVNQEEWLVEEEDIWSLTVLTSWVDPYSWDQGIYSQECKKCKRKWHLKQVAGIDQPSFDSSVWSLPLQEQSMTSSPCRGLTPVL